MVTECVRWGRRENLSQQGHGGGRIFPNKAVMSLAGTGRRVLLLINLLGLVKIERLEIENVFTKYVVYG